MGAGTVTAIRPAKTRNGVSLRMKGILSREGRLSCAPTMTRLLAAWLPAPSASSQESRRSGLGAASEIRASVTPFREHVLRTRARRPLPPLERLERDFVNDRRQMHLDAKRGIRLQGLRCPPLFAKRGDRLCRGLVERCRLHPHRVRHTLEVAEGNGAGAGLEHTRRIAASLFVLHAGAGSVFHELRDRRARRRQEEPDASSAVSGPEGDS